MNTKEDISKETSGNRLNIYQKYLDLIYYSNNIVRKYPKSENFALVKEIKTTLYSGLRNLMYAIKSYSKKDKLKYLNEFDINLTLLKVQGPIDKAKVGIPIGNYTSQFFANIYLNELDHYIKRVLKVKYYTRYMDDFILILKTKKDCISMKKQIESFLATNLQLELNDKSRYYPYKMGVNFCGYRIFTTHRLLRLSSKKKIKKNVKRWNRKYASRHFKFTLCKTEYSILAWSFFSLQFL